MTDLVVIPARYGSTRLPGKPLLPIAGRTLLERTLDLARRAIGGMEGVAITVATDHPAVADHARELGCDAVMTSSAISSGSGRALAAALAQPAPPRFVVNLQGDAPFLPAAAVSRVLAALAAGASVATPLIQLPWPALDALRDHKRTAPFSGTTCLRADTGDALWFSKAVLPTIRDEERLRTGGALSPVFRHLGLYGYTLPTLQRFEALPPSRYERLEGLEQLRLLEAGIAIRTVLVEDQPIPISGIDTAEDIALAEALLAHHGDPFGT